MASFLEKFFESDSLQYKDMLENSLNTYAKFDILFGLALDGKSIFLCFYIKVLVKWFE